MLERFRSRLKGKVIILGIGNTMRSDDGAGSILASQVQGRVPFIVFNAGTTPENYLEKIIKERPDTIVVIDTADFGGSPGEFELLEAKDIKTVNLFSTHNASISLTINYLQNNLEADISILIIQPKSVDLGDKLSKEVADTLDKIVGCFYGKD